jgi:hypothetical protein
MMSLRHRMEAAEAEQERKKRLKRERRENTPAKKRKREEWQQKRGESYQRWMERWQAQEADDAERPLYEVVLDHVDIAAPEHTPLRRRLIIAINREIAELSGLESAVDGKRVVRAREILAQLEAQQ